MAFTHGLNWRTVKKISEKFVELIERIVKADRNKMLELVRARGKVSPSENYQSFIQRTDGMQTVGVIFVDFAEKTCKFSLSKPDPNDNSKLVTIKSTGNIAYHNDKAIKGWFDALANFIEHDVVDEAKAYLASRTRMLTPEDQSSASGLIDLDPL